MARYSSQPSFPQGNNSFGQPGQFGMGNMGRMSALFPFSPGTNLASAAQAGRNNPNPVANIKPQPGMAATAQGVSQLAQQKMGHVEAPVWLKLAFQTPPLTNGWQFYGADQVAKTTPAGNVGLAVTPKPGVVAGGWGKTASAGPLFTTGAVGVSHGIGLSGVKSCEADFGDSLAPSRFPAVNQLTSILKMAFDPAAAAKDTAIAAGASTVGTTAGLGLVGLLTRKRMPLVSKLFNNAAKESLLFFNPKRSYNLLKRMPTAAKLTAQQMDVNTNMLKHPLPKADMSDVQDVGDMFGKQHGDKADSVARQQYAEGKQMVDAQNAYHKQHGEYASDTLEKGIGVGNGVMNLGIGGGVGLLPHLTPRGTNSAPVSDKPILGAKAPGKTGFSQFTQSLTGRSPMKLASAPMPAVTSAPGLPVTGGGQPPQPMPQGGPGAPQPGVAPAGPPAAPGAAPGMNPAAAGGAMPQQAAGGMPPGGGPQGGIVPPMGEPPVQPLPSNPPIAPPRAMNPTDQQQRGMMDSLLDAGNTEYQDSNHEDIQHDLMGMGAKMGHDSKSGFDMLQRLFSKRAAQDNSKDQRSATGESKGLSYQHKPDHYAQGPAAWDSVKDYFKGGKKAGKPNLQIGKHAADKEAAGLGGLVAGLGQLAKSMITSPSAKPYVASKLLQGTAQQKQSRQPPMAKAGGFNHKDLDMMSTLGVTRTANGKIKDSPRRSFTEKADHSQRVRTKQSDDQFLTPFACGFFAHMESLGHTPAIIKMAIDRMGDEYGATAQQELYDGLEKTAAWYSGLLGGGAKAGAKPGVMSRIGKWWAGGADDAAKAVKPPVPHAAPPAPPPPSNPWASTTNAMGGGGGAARAAPQVAAPALSSGQRWLNAAPSILRNGGAGAGFGALEGASNWDSEKGLGTNLWNAGGSVLAGGAAFNPALARQALRSGGGSLALRSLQGRTAGRWAGDAANLVTGRDDLDDWGQSIGTVAGAGAGLGRMRHLPEARNFAAARARAGQAPNTWQSTLGGMSPPPLANPSWQAQAGKLMDKGLSKAVHQGSQFQKGVFQPLGAAWKGITTGKSGLGDAWRKGSVASRLGMGAGVTGMGALAGNYGLGKVQDAVHEGASTGMADAAGAIMPWAQDQMTQYGDNYLRSKGLLGEDGQFNPMGAIGNGIGGMADKLLGGFGMDPSKMSTIQKLLSIGGPLAGAYGLASGNNTIAGLGGLAALGGIGPEVARQYGAQAPEWMKAHGLVGGGSSGLMGSEHGGAGAPGQPQARNELEYQQSMQQPQPVDPRRGIFPNWQQAPGEGGSAADAANPTRAYNAAG